MSGFSIGFGGIVPTMNDTKDSRSHRSCGGSFRSYGGALGSILKATYYDSDQKKDFHELGKSRTATRELVKDVKNLAKRLKADLDLVDYYCRNKNCTVTTNHTECTLHLVAPHIPGPVNHLTIRFEVDAPLRGVNSDYHLNDYFYVCIGEEYKLAYHTTCKLSLSYEDLLREIKSFPEFRRPKMPPASPLLKAEIQLARLANIDPTFDKNGYWKNRRIGLSGSKQGSLLLSELNLVKLINNRPLIDFRVETATRHNNIAIYFYPANAKRKSAIWFQYAKIYGLSSFEQILNRNNCDDEYKKMFRDLESFFWACFPNGIVDLFLLSLRNGKIVCTKEFKQKYSTYEFVELCNEEDIKKEYKIETFWDLPINHKDAYISLVHKARKLLYEGSFTGKKSTERIGTDWLKGGRATEKMFYETFKVRSISFSSTIPQKDRQNLLDSTYNAFMDLTQICKFSTPLVLSNYGSLGIVFGAKKFGKTMAYYNYIDQTLNLTKKEGAGTLAHEWLHSLDNFLGNIHCGISGTHSRFYFISDLVIRPTSYHAEHENYDLIDIMIDWHKKIMPRLDMYHESLSLDRKSRKEYWSMPREIMARQFEAYCLQKLEQQHNKNDFLVENRRGENVYPSENDMEKVIQFFDRFFSSIKVHYQEDEIPHLYGADNDKPEIENNLSQEIMNSIPGSKTERSQFLKSELQRFEDTEIYNKWFDANIVVSKSSLDLVSQIAAKTTSSAIIALNLDAIITNATMVNDYVPKTKSIEYSRIYEMQCTVRNEGTITLEIGEQKRHGKSTYYIISIIVE